jgi:hypothetical protein
MPASFEANMIRDKQWLKRYVAERFGVDTDLPAYRGPKDHCLGGNDSTSSGPIIWILNRLCEREQMPRCGCPDEADDVPLFFVKAGRKTFLRMSPVARSKMFNTPLVVYPIDLVALRVSHLPIKRGEQQCKS